MGQGEGGEVEDWREGVGGDVPGEERWRIGGKEWGEISLGRRGGGLVGRYL